MKLQDLKAKNLSTQMDIQAASSPDRAYRTMGWPCVKPGWTNGWSC